MNPDFRYHVASLAAVFFALGVGILVGTAFVGTPVVQRQTRLITRLEDNLRLLRSETAEQEKNEQALAQIAPLLTKDVLKNRRVLIVQSGTYADAAETAARALQQAGAVSVQRVQLPLAAWSKWEAATGEPRGIIGDEARRLAPLLARGDETGLARFRERGLLTGEAPLNGPYRLIVLVGGASLVRGASEGEAAVRALAAQRDLPLIEAWTATGAPAACVVGVETLPAEVSYLNVYRGAGIATIDNLDRVAGQIALPFALLGDKGAFGIRAEADRVLPASAVLPRAAPAATPAPAASPTAP